MKDFSSFFKLSLGICMAFLCCTQAIQAQNAKPVPKNPKVKTYKPIVSPTTNTNPPPTSNQQEGKPNLPNQQEGKPNLEQIDISNVIKVDFGRNGNKLGHYIETGKKAWKEVGIAKGAGTFEFKELNRDQWSIYLRDETRSVSIQLDLHTKKVMYSDSRTSQRRPLYEIMDVSFRTTGRTVREVTYKSPDNSKKGKFIQKDGKGWVEIDGTGKTIFNFVEQERDDWSVYLFDKSRNAHIQLDLHTKLVSFAVGTQKPYPIYKIIDAQSTVSRTPISNPPVVGKPNLPPPTTDKPTKPQIVLDTPEPSIFVHITAKENKEGNSSILNNEVANGNKNAILFITPNWKATYNPTAMGVGWDGNRWRLVNQNRSTAIPDNYRVNVLAYPRASKNVFVHKATKENIGGARGHMTFIKHPYSNGDSSAQLIVTQNYGNNITGVYNNHAIGVSYDKKQRMWAIFNQDLSPMPENAQFNVMIVKEGKDTGLPVGAANVLQHKSYGDNLVDRMKHVSIIPAKTLLNQPNLALFITSSWNTGVYNRQTAGVYYHGSKWTIYSRDKKAFPENAYFNVLVIDPSKISKETTKEIPSRKKSLLDKMNRSRIGQKRN